MARHTTLYFTILYAAATKTDKIVSFPRICNIVTVYFEIVKKITLKNLLKVRIYYGFDAFHWLKAVKLYTFALKKTLSFSTPSVITMKPLIRLWTTPSLRSI